MIGWIGNAFLLWGTWELGYKKRIGFLHLVVGEILWIHRSWELEIWDGVFLCVVFTFLQINNWRKWK